MIDDIEKFILKNSNFLGNVSLDRFIYFQTNKNDAELNRKKANKISSNFVREKNFRLNQDEQKEFFMHRIVTLYYALHVANRNHLQNYSDDMIFKAFNNFRLYVES